MKITRKAGKIDALQKATKALAKAQAKVGWFESAKYANGTPVAGVAQVQEFGSTRGIPPRPFFRSTVSDKQAEWKKQSEQLVRAAALGKIPAANVMPALGLMAEGHVRATITKLMEPPLQPATIWARKRRLADKGVGAKAGIAKPLVDTGILLNTLTSMTEK